VNSGARADDPAVVYYDSDYPWEDDDRYPENFDSAALAIGLGADVRRFRALATRVEGALLELCCGSGRVAIPLARDGRYVTAVDVSRGMLAGLQGRLEREDVTVRARIDVVEQDVTRLALPRDDYTLAILAFNSLILIPDAEGQRAALHAAYRHLAPGGLLALDIANPLALDLRDSGGPRPVITRRNVHTGRRYTRYSAVDAMDAEQRQRLHGWYDEYDAAGRVHRVPYEFRWRLIFPWELDALLAEAGFDISAVEGDYSGSPYTPSSPTLLVQARKRGRLSATGFRDREAPKIRTPWSTAPSHDPLESHGTERRLQSLRRRVVRHCSVRGLPCDCSRRLSLTLSY